MVTDPIKLVAQAAALLHINGQTTQRVVSASQRLGQALGMAIEVVPQWDAIVLRYRPAGVDPASAWRVEIVSAKPTGVDMNKVARTTAMIDSLVEQGSLETRDQLTRLGKELDAIAADKPSSAAPMGDNTETWPASTLASVG